MERCVYNSYDNKEIESKWMDARLKCELMHPDTTLISVRSENELSIMKGKYYKLEVYKLKDWKINVHITFSYQKNLKALDLKGFGLVDLMDSNPSNGLMAQYSIWQKINFGQHQKINNIIAWSLKRILKYSQAWSVTGIMIYQMMKGIL